MRPRYSNAVFTTPASKQRIDRFEREPVHTQLAPVQPQLTQQQIAEAVAASVPSAVSACLQAMGHSQAMPLATSASAPSGKKAKKKAKKDPAAPQAAQLVPPAPAVPPGYPPGFPPGLPPAAPQAPNHNLVNLVGIIGGAPHEEQSLKPRWLLSRRPTRTRTESRGASTSGVGAPAATPPVVSLTRERAGRAQASLFPSLLTSFFVYHPRCASRAPGDAQSTNPHYPGCVSRTMRATY